MSDTPTDNTQLDEIEFADVAALAMAVAIWLGNKYPDAITEIGDMADKLKEQFIAGE
jgi:hypothetical protein